jgi:hypothetical protein
MKEESINAIKNQLFRLYTYEDYHTIHKYMEKTNWCWARSEGMVPGEAMIKDSLYVMVDDFINFMLFELGGNDEFDIDKYNRSYNNNENTFYYACGTGGFHIFNYLSDIWICFIDFNIDFNWDEEDSMIYGEEFREFLYNGKKRLTGCVKNMVVKKRISIDELFLEKEFDIYNSIEI